MGWQEDLKAAIRLHEAGDVDRARHAYTAILRADSSCADAWSLLGLLLSQIAEHESAIQAATQATRFQPDHAEFLNNLGVVLRAAGKMSQAREALATAVKIDPQHTRARNNLAVVLLESNLPAEAEWHLRRVLEDCDAGGPPPNQHADALANLGNALRGQGKFAEAIDLFRQTIHDHPQDVAAWNNLGACLEALHQWESAADAYRQAVRANPRQAESLNNLGSLLLELGRIDEGIGCFEQAVLARPDFLESRFRLANAWFKYGDDSARARECFEETLAIDSNHLDSYIGLSNVLRAGGDHSGSIQQCQRLLEIEPNCITAHLNMGLATSFLGDPDAAAACYQNALKLDPTCVEAHSNLVYIQQFRAAATLAELAEHFAEWDRCHALPLEPAPSELPRLRERATRRELSALRELPAVSAPTTPTGTSTDDRLRIAFTSPNFGNHPCGFFFIRCLESLDRDEVDVSCYSDRTRSDAMTARIAALSNWKNARGLSDDELARQIRDDRIDVLIAMASHTRDNRLLMFARRPAPVQMMWTGGGPAGMSAIPYLIADANLIPPEFGSRYRERPVRLPDGYVCFEPPMDAPAVSDPPARQRGQITFGSFNQFNKLTAEVLSVWSRILRAVPDSRLLLKCQGGDSTDNRSRLRAAFSDRGIDGRRLLFSGSAPRREFVAAYQEVDIALDPFPFSGGITTCEAIWMGVPVVTMPGETLASRTSLSHLRNVGAADTIAADVDQYVELAVSLAGNVERLTSMRGELRDRMAASPLCDGPRFATNFVAMLKAVCREHSS